MQFLLQNHLGILMSGRLLDEQMAVTCHSLCLGRPRTELGLHLQLTVRCLALIDLVTMYHQGRPSGTGLVHRKRFSPHQPIFKPMSRCVSPCPLAAAWRTDTTFCSASS